MPDLPTLADRLVEHIRAGEDDAADAVLAEMHAMLDEMEATEADA